MRREDRYKAVIDYFERAMPVAESELNFENPYQLLVAVILEAYPTPFDLAKASAEEIYEYIRSISYPNNKAKNLAAMARMLVTEFGGEVPSDIEQMMRLPGVGRKTANVVGAVVWNKEVMPVDTHVFRVSARIGLSVGAKTPRATELQLEKYIPSHLLPKAHHWLILHGRYTCIARKPKCGDCGITQWCKYFQSKQTKAQQQKRGDYQN